MINLAELWRTRSASMSKRINVRRRRVGLADLCPRDVEKYVMAARLDLARATAMYNLFMSECAFLRNAPSRELIDALQDGIFLLPEGVVHVFDRSAVAVLVLRNFSYGKTNLEMLKQSIIFQIMQVADTDSWKTNGMTLLIDCSGALYSRNWSAWLGRWLLNALEHMLPVQLHHVYFVRAPLWMNMSVLGIRMFMSSSVSTRVSILNDLDPVLEKKYHSLAFRSDDSVYALLNRPPLTFPEFLRIDEVSASSSSAAGPGSIPDDELPPVPTTVPGEEEAGGERKEAECDRDTVFDGVSTKPNVEDTCDEDTRGNWEYAHYALRQDFVISALAHITRKSALQIKHEYDGVHQANASSGEAKRAENEHKNRYTNIMAYDHSRVKLVNVAHLSDPVPTDYINANFVAGYDRPNKYIATQGPLRHTAHAFWLMVFEQKSNTIVMVTRETEKKRVKCERYWPEEGATNEYEGGGHRLVVTNNGEEYAEEYIIRSFVLESGGESLVVNHFQYTGWPDFGVPTGEHGTEAMLHFWILLVLKSQKECAVQTAPIVTHCSAGIGRTGTLILLDRALEELHKSAAVNLAASLAVMRKCRYGLVMTAEQYNFVYMMLQDYLAQIPH